MCEGVCVCVDERKDTLTYPHLREAGIHQSQWPALTPGGRGEGRGEGGEWGEDYGYFQTFT